MNNIKSINEDILNLYGRELHDTFLFGSRNCYVYVYARLILTLRVERPTNTKLVWFLLCCFLKRNTCSIKLLGNCV